MNLNKTIKTSNIKILPFGLLIILLFVPLIIKSSYTIHLFIMAIIFSILTMGLNIISGYMGAISIGHAAFYGIGAYASAILTKNFEVPFFLSMCMAIIITGLFGLFLAIPSLKLRSSYLVITTIAFGKIINLIMVNAIWLTRGPLGIMSIPNPKFNIFGIRIEIFSKIHYYYFILFFLLFVIFIYYNLINSKTGRAIIALREDEIASEIMGINVVYYKVITFVIGASTAGLAGALYAHYIRFLSPETFTMLTSIEILVMMIIGGSGTFYGPIVGSFVVTFLLEQLRFMENLRLMFYGIILFIVIFLMPKGVVGFLENIKINFSGFKNENR